MIIPFHIDILLRFLDEKSSILEVYLLILDNLLLNMCKTLFNIISNLKELLCNMWYLILICFDYCKYNTTVKNILLIFLIRLCLAIDVNDITDFWVFIDRRMSIAYLLNPTSPTYQYPTNGGGGGSGGSGGWGGWGEWAKGNSAYAGCENDTLLESIEKKYKENENYRTVKPLWNETFHHSQTISMRNKSTILELLAGRGDYSSRPINDREFALVITNAETNYRPHFVLPTLSLMEDVKNAMAEMRPPVR